MKLKVMLALGAGSLTTLFGLATGTATAQTPSGEPPAGNEQLLILIDLESKANRKKDEFETTDAYQKRVTENVGRQFLVTAGLGADPYGLRKTKAFSYNADTQTLTVTMVGDSSIELIKVIDLLSDAGRRIPPEVTLSGRYTKFTLVRTGPDHEKDYEGQNAMGARATISVFKSTFKAVAILNIPEYLSMPLGSMGVKIASEAARGLSQRAQWRLLIQTAMAPGQKSLVVDDGDYYKPTIDDPIESYTVGHTITASLLRAELVDPDNGAVIASFGPKGEQPIAIPTTSKDHAVLGVLLTPVSSAIAAALDLSGTDGAMVTTVAPGGAADKAGIKQGDILLIVAGKEIKSVLDVSAALAGVPQGNKAVVTLIHQGVKAEITIGF